MRSQEIVTDRLGHVTVLEYDAVGNVVAQDRRARRRDDVHVRRRGNQLTETDPLGRIADQDLRRANNVLTSTDFDGNTTTKTYDARQRL